MRRRFLNALMPNFGVLGSPLFRPENDLAAEAAALYAANVPPGSVVIGTHIRCARQQNLRSGSPCGLVLQTSCVCTGYLTGKSGVAMAPRQLALDWHRPSWSEAR